MKFNREKKVMVKLFGVLVLACLCLNASCAAGNAPVDLRCEYLKDPLGIDVLQPRLSWRLESGERGQKQTAYRILVASSPEQLETDSGDLWDTGKVSSDQSVLVTYAGKPLESRMHCYWKVRFWDKDDEASAWSQTAMWSMGLLDPKDWQAEWIGLDSSKPKDKKSSFESASWIWFPVPGDNPATAAPAGEYFFRHSFKLPQDRKVKSAKVWLTCDDSATLWLNGKEILRVESWKAYKTAEIADKLLAGDNLMTVQAKNLGDAPNPAGMIGVIKVEFETGPSLEIVTDSQWKVSDKMEQGWDAPGYPDTEWKNAKVLGQYGMAPWGEFAPPDEDRELPARYVRREFGISKKIKSATAYMSGLGYSELYLNGRKVDNRVMDPTHTLYTKRIMYVTFDVTQYLCSGRNAAGVILGNGRFFAPRVSIPAPTPTFGYPKLLLQLYIEYADGTREFIVSDASWKITDEGPIRANNEFDGEEYDARMEMPGWDRAGFDDSKWSPVDLVDAPGGKLIAQMLEPMRVIETNKPLSIANPKPGVYVADFGQNLYGMVRIKVKGPRGTRIAIRSTFDRHPDGMITMEPNRSALSTDVYTLKGEGVETWVARFRGQGTRYAELTGWPGTPTVDDVEFLVVHSDLNKVGTFSCSNELVNQIYANLVRSVRMQERGVPMDPDRDERQAWLSVSEKTSETEGFIYDVGAFYTSFLGEARIDQREDGCLSDAGSYWTWSRTGDPCWPAVVTAVPWSCYLMYGDRRILAENYPMMNRWVRFLEARLDPDFIYRKGQYADWVDASSMDNPNILAAFGSTSRQLLWTAYMYYNCSLVAQIADLLGKPEDAEHFRATADKIAKAFHKTFFDPETNTYESKTQTSYVLPLAFGLVPSENRQAVIDNLVEDIMVTNNGHLTVGCPGIKWLMQTLTEIGRTDVAYTILSRDTRPSWGYMVRKGGTSIWERWDGDTATPGMNGQSQTILAGYLGAWMYQSLGGINYDPTQPGFKHIIMKPDPVGDLKWVKASYDSVHGRIASEWAIDEGRFQWTVVVPPNTTATVYVPAVKMKDVTENGRNITKSPGVEFLRMEKGRAVIKVDAGSYEFVSSNYE